MWYQKRLILFSLSMKKTIAIATALLLAGSSFAQTKPAAKPATATKAAATPAKPAISNIGKWSLDASHSNIKFSVTHMMVTETEGSFKIFSGSVNATKEDFSDSQVEFSADAKSINTDNEDRDKHLRSGDFFDAEKYPQITFKATSFKKVKGNQYTLIGDLTMHGVTKKVTFNATYGGTMKDPWGNTKAGFKATTKINRKDFGLMWNAALEAGGAVVSDEVSIVVNVELKKES